ncbi:hypothetical protein BEP19_10365 [Ammoniphilus oxalaticus]|uniref:Abasic site processing protein n=1 Tax=Ammoniphilus oxalaticus TaxID=66863 RepID=A0A419SFT8_9BACL|nr:SOS response-associated peptidase [Ammoniphilus oxalaticus]RKD22653.1 hypothetical protein BEP19_10365 [Ammoniphilus oxalaticus]
MCGRFTLTGIFDELIIRYGIEYALDPFHDPRYNVAPMQMIAAVIHDGERNRLGQLRWGLVPSWAKDESMASRMINARSETLLERPSFRNLVSRKRCLIPADSFYEWKTINGKKQPIRFMLEDESIFSMAGLYDSWICPKSGEKISTCTIITTSPNELVADVHDRMPVILRKEDEQKWINGHNTDTAQLLSLLVPFSEAEMKCHTVSPIVGNVRNDGPECIEKVILN